jgi:hypothetical protein
MNGDINELVNIHKKTNEAIKKALCGIDNFMTDKQDEVCNLVDTKQRLLKEINELKKTKEEIIKINSDIDKMYGEIKEKRKIIVDVDKPKKHKIKEEE